MTSAPYPKIELHVHLEGTVGPTTLLEIARRNGEEPLARSEAELRELYQFRDFSRFIEVWVMTTNVLRTERDFRQVVTDYAAEAVGHRAVYAEAIFSPAERVQRGVGWDDLFAGYCDGALAAAGFRWLVMGLSVEERCRCCPRSAAAAGECFGDNGLSCESPTSVLEIPLSERPAGTTAHPG
jgi:adenosine deaminase